MASKPKTPEPTVAKACYIALPSKNCVIEQMSDGTVRFRGTTTEFIARTAAHQIDKGAFQVPSQTAIEAIASVAFVAVK